MYFRKQKIHPEKAKEIFYLINFAHLYTVSNL
jgi:hypothetical protein